MAETYEPYATREDMQELRSDLIDRIGAIRSDLIDRIGTVRSDLIDRIGAVETRLTDRISRLDGLLTIMVRLTLITTAAVLAGAIKIIFFSG